jgi:hypothetical protein
MAIRTSHQFVSLILCSYLVISASFLASVSKSPREGQRIREWATVRPDGHNRTSTALCVASSLIDAVPLECNPRKTFHRSIDESTWILLNETNVGEMNQSDFELAEMIVKAWSLRQTKRAALVVERLLRRIVKEQMAENPYADCVDMTALYANLIDGWANCGEVGGAERAEEILDYFQRIYEEGDSYDPLLCGPGIRSFNAVIGAFARSGSDDAPQQAVRVLGKLYDLNREGRTCVTPNKETYARTS